MAAFSKKNLPLHLFWFSSLSLLYTQAINGLAQNLKIEALSDDGVIEAISIPEHPSFAVGVQWHAEYEPENNELNRCLFKEFGLACSEYVKKK